MEGRNGGERKSEGSKGGKGRKEKEWREGRVRVVCGGKKENVKREKME